MSNKTEIKSIVEKMNILGNIFLPEDLFLQTISLLMLMNILFMAIGSRLLSVRIFC